MAEAAAGGKPDATPAAAKPAVAKGGDLESAPLASSRAAQLAAAKARTETFAFLNSPEGVKETEEQDHRRETNCCGLKPRDSLFGWTMPTAVRKTHNANYAAADLSSWNALMVMSGTVWDNPSLWKAMGWTMLLAMFVALISLMVVDDPAALNVSKFNELSAFLNVFVGLLMGFFLSSSVSRWYQCADGFLEFFDAVRNLQMQFHALGVPEESESVCVRYAILSAWLLRLELYVAAKDSGDKKGCWDHHWNVLRERRPGLMLDDEEQFILERCHRGHGEPSLLLWTWIASKVGRMAEDGEIPAMPTPTYGRVMNVLQVAHGGIRTVRGSITVQAPFIYVHMLSTLVHVNNFINAISFGLTAGTTAGVVLQYLDRGKGGNDYYQNAGFHEVRHDMQNTIVSFVFSIFGPFIYHALLEVAICIAQPFDNDDGDIPTNLMISHLERDVVDAKIFAETVYQWPKPCYGSINK